jgi:N6-L-threonylcarbamoyladenine synthase
VFDKAARLLELPSSTQASGAVIEQYAALPPLPPFDLSPTPPLPNALPDSSRIAFSFSGTLAATARRIEELKARAQVERDTGISDEGIKREMSRVFQESVIGHLCTKVNHATKHLGLGGSKLGGLVVSGGVASNQHLRTRYVPILFAFLTFLLTSQRLGEMTSKIGTSLYFPPIGLCTGKAQKASRRNKLTDR